VEIELHPSVGIKCGTFTVLVAPAALLMSALDRCISPRRFLVIYICGNYSRILSGIGSRFSDLDIRRAFTAFQLLSILEETEHTVVFIEHDPTLYENLQESLDYVSMAMREVASHSAVVLWSPIFDPTLKAISGMADRIVCIEEEGRGRAGRASGGRARSSSNGGQATLEVF